MVRRKFAKIMVFIMLFTVAMAFQVVQQEKIDQKNTLYAQQKAQAKYVDSGIRERIVEGFVNQDWEGLMERSIRQAKKESAEVLAYTEEITEQLQIGAEKGMGDSE